MREFETDVEAVLHIRESLGYSEKDWPLVLVQESSEFPGARLVSFEREVDQGGLGLNVYYKVVPPVLHHYRVPVTLTIKAKSAEQAAQLARDCTRADVVLIDVDNIEDIDEGGEETKQPVDAGEIKPGDLVCLSHTAVGLCRTDNGLQGHSHIRCGLGLVGAVLCKTTEGDDPAADRYDVRWEGGITENYARKELARLHA